MESGSVLKARAEANRYGIPEGVIGDCQRGEFIQPLVRLGTLTAGLEKSLPSVPQVMTLDALLECQQKYGVRSWMVISSYGLKFFVGDHAVWEDVCRTLNKGQECRSFTTRVQSGCAPITHYACF